MAQEFWPLARRDEGAKPKHSATRRRREPGCTGDKQRRQRPKEQAGLLPLFVSSDLSPLVIFRKVCLGTRSATGSENISVFGSLTQTAALPGAKRIDMFRALFPSSPTHGQDVIFGDQPKISLSG